MGSEGWIARISRHSASPLRSGRPISRMTASTPPGTSASLFIASDAEPAASTRKPASSRYSVASIWMRASSSTSRIRPGAWRCIQDVSQLGSQRGLSERLGDQFDAGIESSVMDDRIAGVSRREENLEVRPALAGFVCKLRPFMPPGSPMSVKSTHTLGMRSPEAGDRTGLFRPPARGSRVRARSRSCSCGHPRHPRRREWFRAASHAGQASRFPLFVGADAAWTRGR